MKNEVQKVDNNELIIKNNKKKIDLKKILKTIYKVFRRILVIIKRIIVAIYLKLKEISNTKYGKVDGKYVATGIVVVFIIAFIGIINLFGNGDVDYPVVFNNKDNDLYLLTKNGKSKDDSIKLGNGENTSQVVYANNTDRYMLFIKKDDLYLYDKRETDETTKIVDNVRGYNADYMFSHDDKYVIALDAEGRLRVFNFKETKTVDKDVSRIVEVSDNKIIYEKERTIFVRSINPKKDDRLKVTEEYNDIDYIKISEDEKNILFIDDTKELRIFNIKKDEDEKIATNVSNYFCDTKSCKKLYYEAKDDTKSVYYYNGKENTRIAKDIVNISAANVDKRVVLFTKSKNGKYSLYYQKANNDPVLIEDDMFGLIRVELFDATDVYFITTEHEVKYAKVSNNRLRVVKSLAEDVTGSFFIHKDGYVVVADVKEGSGNLLLLKNGKAKELDENVYSAGIRINKEGKKIYYLKDYKRSGDLYVSNGGKSKCVEKDVRTYEYMHDNLIYLIRDYSESKRAGDLYRYTGKSVKVASEVTSIASSNTTYRRD